MAVVGCGKHGGESEGTTKWVENGPILEEGTMGGMTVKGEAPSSPSPGSSQRVLFSPPRLQQKHFLPSDEGDIH